MGEHRRRSKAKEKRKKERKEGRKEGRGNRDIDRHAIQKSRSEPSTDGLPVSDITLVTDECARARERVRAFSPGEYYESNSRWLSASVTSPEGRKKEEKEERSGARGSRRSRRRWKRERGDIGGWRESLTVVRGDEEKDSLAAASVSGLAFCDPLSRPS